MKQFDDTLRNALLQAYEDAIGTSPKLRFYEATSPPANCAAAATGTQLVELTNATADWRGAPSAGVSALSGTFGGEVATAGLASYYRVYNSAGSACREQGLITKAFSLTTSAGSTSSNVLTFSATTGAAVGQAVTIPGVVSGATVLEVTGTTVKISSAVTVGSGVAVYFGDTSGELYLPNTTLGVGQVLTVTLWTRTAPGA